MFVQIHLDSSATERVLTVPAAAVVEIEGQNYVFIPAKNTRDEHTFSPRPVEIGPKTSDRVVIKAGLNQGDEIVSSGTFILKSELILQNQTDEEE